MKNFERTIIRRFQIVDFNVVDNNDIYINDILFEPILSGTLKNIPSPAQALYDLFYAGATIEVNYYCPTDGHNFPKKFKIRYIKPNYVEVIKV